MSTDPTGVKVAVYIGADVNRGSRAASFADQLIGNHVIDLMGQRPPSEETIHQALSFIGSFAATNACSIKGSIWLATAFTTGTTTLFPN